MPNQEGAAVALLWFSIDVVCVVRGGSLLRSAQPSTESSFRDWQTSG